MLAAVLAAAAVAKLAAGTDSRAALATFGLRGARSRALAWAAVVGLELVLAGGVATGVDAAAFAAAALLAGFAAALAVALARGRAGAPCACFGARSRVSAAALARDGVLAGAFAALPALPRGDVSAQTWLALGLGVALAGVVALAVAVLALAREVGLLRLAAGAQGALEVPDEGPPVGEPSALAERFAPRERSSRKVKPAKPVVTRARRRRGSPWPSSRRRAARCARPSRRRSTCSRASRGWPSRSSTRRATPTRGRSPASRAAHTPSRSTR